ncbi:hypothetical protein FLM9_144 [Candidatus Synechococcus spongiarum]|uniref:Uncharacterized protein n=1 Tax=Candidatus Synechococcus spongiarum TaxID=431041 RepID=A0A164Y0Q0_9SYNE|nr:hypothetical protein FLM9_144 [Candidatus Synechococcus spongiarum]
MAFQQAVQLFIQGFVVFPLLSPHGLLPVLRLGQSVFHIFP